MSRRLKVGVVGAGIGGNHIAAFHKLPDLYAVEAVCDIDAERAGVVASQHGIANAVTSYDELLDLDLDVVDICTPSNLHFAQARQALAAGRHVIVEKPLAGSLAEVDALQEAEAASDGRVAPVFQYRYGNGFRRFMHLKAKGIVGTPYVATVDTHWCRRPAYYDNPWRGRWAAELGGTLVTHAIHAHDMMCEVMGPIRTLFARTATRVNRIETEDCAALVLEMESGALVTLSVTLGSEREISRLRFCFDGLTVENGSDLPYEPGAEPWQFIATDEDTLREIGYALADFVPLPERWTGQFLALHGALTEGTAMPVTVADARRSIELATAAYASSRSGMPVDFPIGREHPFYQGWLPRAVDASGAA